jgi:deoxyribodipyrimidine photo-lyase
VPKINIFWFRRDLRLEDNIGLFNCSGPDVSFLPVFIFDPYILDKLKNKNDSRVQFIHSTLSKIKDKLQSTGSDLRVYFDTCEDAWKKIITEFDVGAVYSNEDYEPYAIKRDKTISLYLEKNNISFYQFKDQCIFSKNDVLKKDGTPYTVYTPYKNSWYGKLEPKNLMSVSNKKGLQKLLKIKPRPMVKMIELGFKQTVVSNQVRAIRKKIISSYKEKRDIPSLAATSMLGLHLRFGTVSVRKCAQAGYHSEEKTWLDELIWREFFMQILYHFPYVVKGAFKKKYNAIAWNNSKKDFKLWCEGRTGYPLVDAGMRELNETGHMHNRVRMVTASFLVKHLLIDWRWGEKYFADKLLDFELSANNGNWQWVAGTGCDSAPYFRIFNPQTQQKKFDPDFIYIKKWIPEYATDKYPQRMIDHKYAYDRALITYKTSLMD